MQLDKAELYVVDRLLEMRVVNARNKPVEIESGDKLLAGHSKQYKVRWKGYGEADDTWEPQTNINAAALLGFERGDPVNPKEGATGEEQWLARIPANMHPSELGYKTARTAVVYNTMATVAKGGAKGGSKKAKSAAAATPTTATGFGF